MALVIRLAAILAERNMTQTELARRCGVDKNTISRWVSHGRTRIDLDVLEKICDELDVTPNDLFVKVNH